MLKIMKMLILLVRNLKKSSEIRTAGYPLPWLFGKISFCIDQISWPTFSLAAGSGCKTYLALLKIACLDFLYYGGSFLISGHCLMDFVKVPLQSEHQFCIFA